MHAIHTTPGLIIDSRPYGEAGKMLSIFTRDLGLVMAAAQGIRLEKSKLRYHVQNHSFGMYSLVRGKELWRLTSASGQEEYSSSKKSSEPRRRRETGAASADADAGFENRTIPPAAELVARISLLLRRLLQGEEPHPELFDIVHSCLGFASRSPDLTDEQIRSIESLAVLRMLHVLGYIGKEPQFADCLASSEMTADLIAKASTARILINKHINKALKESHL